MNTTPEQIAKWREEFEATYLPEHLLQRHGVYIDRDIQHSWQGYLRAKQETEQAVKDARRQALEEAIAICNATCDPSSTEHGNGYNRAALDCEKKIKEISK